MKYVGDPDQTKVGVEWSSYQTKVLKMGMLQVYDNDIYIYTYVYTHTYMQYVYIYIYLIIYVLCT